MLANVGVILVPIQAVAKLVTQPIMPSCLYYRGIVDEAEHNLFFFFWKHENEAINEDLD